MFPFGSVLMHIPLIILAFAYLVYAGAAAVNKLKPCDEPDLHALAKVQNVSVSEITFDQGAYFWHQDTDEDPQTVVEPAEKAQRYKQFYFQPVFIPDRTVPYPFTGNSIFSRPPPYLG